LIAPALRGLALKRRANSAFSNLRYSCISFFTNYLGQISAPKSGRQFRSFTFRRRSTRHNHQSPISARHKRGRNYRRESRLIIQISNFVYGDCQNTKNIGAAGYIDREPEKEILRTSRKRLERLNKYLAQKNKRGLNR
jgi:hypothetical protein